MPTTATGSCEPAANVCFKGSGMLAPGLGENGRGTVLVRTNEPSPRLRDGVPVRLVAQGPRGQQRLYGAVSAEDPRLPACQAAEPVAGPGLHQQAVMVGEQRGERRREVDRPGRLPRPEVGIERLPV